MKLVHQVLSRHPVDLTRRSTMPPHTPRHGSTAAVAELPTGTVTFLFTDVEGSTSHWRLPGRQGYRCSVPRSCTTPEEGGSRHSDTREYSVFSPPVLETSTISEELPDALVTVS